MSAPALAVGAGTIVKTIVLVAFPQGAFPIAVRESVTLPAALSAALGVYIGVKVVPPVNIPVPEVPQLTELLLVAVAPAMV
jgi:hypothetical protein